MNDDSYRDMLAAVQAFHDKHDFKNTGGEDLTYRVEHNLDAPNILVAQTSMLKNFATQTLQFCADQAVQILGGMGYIRESRVERIYREVKVLMIGGGAEEIMKDLAAKQMKF